MILMSRESMDIWVDKKVNLANRAIDAVTFKLSIR